jgi:hypothetical protein
MSHRIHMAHDKDEHPMWKVLATEASRPPPRPQKSYPAAENHRDEECCPRCGALDVEYGRRGFLGTFVLTGAIGVLATGAHLVRRCGACGLKW